jgi:hypothetical protein
MRLGSGRPSIDFNGTKYTHLEGSAADSNISIGRGRFDPLTQRGIALTTRQAKELGVKVGDSVQIRDNKTGQLVTATYYDNAGRRPGKQDVDHFEVSPALADTLGIQYRNRNGQVVDAVTNTESLAGRFSIERVGTRTPTPGTSDSFDDQVNPSSSRFGRSVRGNVATAISPFQGSSGYDSESDGDDSMPCQRRRTSTVNLPKYRSNPRSFFQPTSFSRPSRALSDSPSSSASPLVGIRSGGGWGGSENVTNPAVELARRLGVQVTSTKRNSTLGGESSTHSDHHVSQKNAYAVDLGVSGAKGDQLALEIAKKYGIPESNIGTSNKHVITTEDGRRFQVQLLWRVKNHYDHIHLGVRAL